MRKLNLPLRFALLVVLSLFGRNVWAQSGHYVIEQRYVQQIFWTEDEYVLKYEVTVEKSESGIYSVYSKEFTESTNIQISLPPGNYRYRVVPYDFLEQPGEPSEWKTLFVKPADDELVSAAIEQQTETFLKEQAEQAQKEEAEKAAQAASTASAKATDDVSEDEFAEVGRLASVYASLAWTPTIPLHGNIQKIYESKFFAPGFTIRLGMFFLKFDWFDLGAEMTTSWYGLNANIEGVKIDSQTGITNINVVAQKWLNPKMAITLKVGGGIIYQVVETNINDDIMSDGNTTSGINMEATFLWLAYKQLYLEGGFNYTVIFNRDAPSGLLHPVIGVGWRF